MGRIQSSVGLATGTDIAGTVEKLVALSAGPMNRLNARTENLKKEQTAITDLTTLVIGTQLASAKLSFATQFQARKATSANENALTVTSNEQASVGSLKAKVVQTATTHSVQTSALTTDATAALGISGEITIRAGGFLDSSVELKDLNQGLGVQKGSIRITDRAGNVEDIDLRSANTIDDVIDAINNASKVRVSATTSGDSIQLRDLSGATTGNLRVTEVGGGETAADLGLRGIDVAASSATGTDIYGAITDTQPTGLRGVPLSKLAGGTGISGLTAVTITTTDGASQLVDLSSATTTQDVLQLLNDSGLKIDARLNDSGAGFRIRDLSGGSTQSFTITSTDATATKLGIAANTDKRVIEGSDLQRQFIDRDTKLSTLRQGRGIDGGIFTIVNSNQQQSTVDLTDAAKLTVGDLIDGINSTNISVTASINATGDGIVLRDSSGGSEPLKVIDIGSDTSAKDLGLTGDSVDSTFNGSPVKVLDGRQADQIKFSTTDSLQDIVSRINEQAGFATASIVTSQDGKLSLSLKSARGGDAGRVSVSATGTDLGFKTTSVGNDAIIDVIGDDGSTKQLRSADGVFTDVQTGVSLTAKKSTDDYVDIKVDRDSSAVVSNVSAFVTQYNKLVDKLTALNFYNTDTQEVGLLFGSRESLQISQSFGRFFSGSITGAGAIKSFGEVGISINDTGKLELDEAKLRSKLESNSTAVSEFFTTKDNGFVARINKISDRIAGVNNSLLLNRGTALSSLIERNTSRATTMQTRLDLQKERLTAQYQASESAIAKLQGYQTAISQISYISSSSN